MIARVKVKMVLLNIAEVDSFFFSVASREQKQFGEEACEVNIEFKIRRKKVQCIRLLLNEIFRVGV